jgi:hypothetical protein
MLSLCVKHPLARFRADVEHSSPEGVASCEEHRPGEDRSSQTSMDYEQFMGIVLRIAAVWPGGCIVYVDPPRARAR